MTNTDVTFDPGAFMQSTIDQPLETEFRLVPEGMYPAMIGDFDETAIERIEFEYRRGPKAGQPGSMVKLTLPFSIQDDKVKAELQRENVNCQMQLILDIDPSGRLDFGQDKNIKLGQVRNAVGQNTPGPWTIGQLKGAGPLMVKVTHEEVKTAGGEKMTFARVTRVAPLST